MDSERLQQIQDLFHGALEHDPGERRAYLDAACHGDPDLRSTVERYLAADAEDFSLLDDATASLPRQFFALQTSSQLERLETALANRYVIERELGRGGMATVYLARDIRHEREVAVKVLRPELAAALGADRFLREIKVTAGLQHPHILPVYDSGAASGLLYYVVPYVLGGSLRDRMQRETQLPLEDALGIARQVASALDFAHRHGVIHRDVKPENILIQETVPLVADFGIALAVSTADAERITETGLALGTPAYMSPEQVAGDREIDARSDIYSLACVLYEMLAGQPPFTGARAQVVLARHVTDPVPPISTARSSVSPPLAAAITRALAKAPADRFASARAFADALFAKADDAVPERHGIVVLPFENLSPDPDNEYFSDGLTEEIIATLRRIPNLRVLSRTSVMKYKGTAKDIAQIAGELDARTVVEGSVRKAGDRVRIVAQAVDARAGEHLWSETYDRRLEDIFEIQSDVAARVSEAVRAELPEEQKADLARPGTTDVDAYDLYLKGRFLWNQRTAAALRSSVEWFTKAIERDPRFALAHAGLADSFTTLGVYGVSNPHEVMAAARDAAAAALKIDPTLCHALTARACVRAVYDWDWEEAAMDFEHALQCDPEYATAHQWYAVNVHIPQRRFDAARLQLEHATRLEPLSSAIAASRGVLAYFERDYSRAMEEYENTRSLHPHFGLVHFFIGQCETARGEYGKALEALRRAVDLTSHSPETLAALGHCLALSGNAAEATEVLSQLEKRGRTDYVSPVLEAQILTGLGEHDAAMDKLEAAAELRASDLIWLGVRPVFDPLRSEPGFERLLETIGLH